MDVPSWTKVHDERLKTHFDLVNSTDALKQYLGQEIEVMLFSGEKITGILAKAGWDYISLQISYNATENTRIDFVREGREEYVISSIRLSTGSIIYDHIDPKAFPFTPPDVGNSIERIIP